jgi:hypothetical protein
MVLLATDTGNYSVPDPKTAGFRSCDSPTFNVDLLQGAGQNGVPLFRAGDVL